MGIVYKVQDTVLDRIVAFKVLPQALTENPQAITNFMREAHVNVAVPNELKLLWTYQAPNSQLSSPVAMESSVLVANLHQHRIDAIDSETGKRKWSFVADGPITGSPTIADGMCVFGCSDGWVYAVHLDDGAVTTG